MSLFHKGRKEIQCGCENLALHKTAYLPCCHQDECTSSSLLFCSATPRLRDAPTPAKEQGRAWFELDPLCQPPPLLRLLLLSAILQFVTSPSVFLNQLSLLVMPQSCINNVQFKWNHYGVPMGSFLLRSCLSLYQVLTKHPCPSALKSLARAAFASNLGKNKHRCIHNLKQILHCFGLFWRNLNIHWTRPRISEPGWRKWLEEFFWKI